MFKMLWMEPYDAAFPVEPCSGAAAPAMVLFTKSSDCTMKAPCFQGYRAPLLQLLTRSAGGTERKQTCPSRSASSPTVPLEQKIRGDEVSPLLIED